MARNHPLRGRSEETNTTDVKIGSRVRTVRHLRGMSQGDLAEACGITFQQVQKYEKGINRISASRLVQFSRVLKIPINYFFEDIVLGTEKISLPRNAAEFLGRLRVLKNDDRANIMHTLRALTPDYKP